MNSFKNIQKQYDILDHRLPRDGEDYVDSNNVVRTAGGNHTTVSRLIVRKKFEWPEWLKANYIAMDENGSWWAFNNRPEAKHCDWAASGGGVELDADFLDIELPTPCDWEDSLRKRPNE